MSEAAVVVTPERQRADLATRSMAALKLRQAGIEIGKAPKPSLVKWVSKNVPGYKWYKHCRLVAKYLEMLIHGDLREVFLFEPPRHGKSEQTSRILPAYYLSNWQHRWVGLSSYGASLAGTFSRHARQRFVGVLSDEVRASSSWETARGGGMWAAGVGGAITGKGYHLGICDDPIKNAEEAASAIVQAKNGEWWDSTWTTRAEPKGGRLLAMTRWHMNDTAGYALRNLDSYDGVAIIHLPAIAEPREQIQDLYASLPGVHIAPDWREPGQPLCPERYTLDDLLRKQRNSTDYFWSGMYQQRPSVRGGSMFPRETVKIVEALPAEGVRIHLRYWDKAGTEGGGAYTAGLKLLITGRGDQERVIIEDVVRGQWREHPRESVIKETAKMDGTTCYQRVEQEPGSGGKDSADSTVANLAGFRVGADRPTGDKTLRAEPIAAQWQAGNVSLLAGDWNAKFLSEAETFPTGTFRDQIDALSGAYKCARELIGNRRLVGAISGPRYPAFVVGD